MKKFSKILALSMALALTFGMTVCADESPDTYKELVAASQEVVDKTTAVNDDGVEVTLEKKVASVEDIEATDTAVEKPTNALSITVAKAAGVNTDDKNVTVTAVKLLVMQDITPDPSIAAGTVITVTIPYKVDSSVEGKSYVLMHQGKDGWEKANNVSYDATKGEFTFKGVVGKDFSNYAVFEVTAVVKTSVDNNNGSGNSNSSGSSNGGTTTTQAPASDQPVSPKTGESVPVAGFAALILLAGAAVCAKKVQLNN